MRRDSERGYALVAAVASIGVFAAMALAALSATRLTIEDVSAEEAQLRAAAAADAGIALALSKLLATDRAERWSIDGRTRHLTFNAARLRIRVEDEWGKVPVSQLEERQVTRLLEAAGLTGERLLIARDSLLDWTDADDTRRPFGAEAPDYAAAGLRPANGALASIDELGNIRGFDANLVNRIRPFLTPLVLLGGFDPRYADPRALAVMEEAGADSPAAIERARELAGQRTAIELADAVDLTGRALTIDVEAQLADGGRAHRRARVELTGAPARPYVVRAYE